MSKSQRSMSVIVSLAVLFVSLLFLAQAPPAQAALSAPTTFTLSTVSASQINASWTAVTGATSYELYRRPASSATYVKVATTTGLTYSSTGLAAGTQYYFKVRAMQSTTPGAYTVEKSAWTKPAAPTGLTAASPSTTQINLAWSAVTGATGYKIYRSVGTSTTYSLLTSVTTLYYHNTGLTSATRYNYRVYAVNTGGTSASAAVTWYTRPVAPATATATKMSNTSIKVDWSAVTGATKYKVYVSKNAAAYVLAATVSAPTVTYTATGLTGGSYVYKVSAVAGSSEGAKSVASNSVTLPTLLPAPTGFTATTYNYQSVNLGWTGVVNAASYRVYYSKTASSDVATYSYFDWASAGTRVIGLDANTTYYFRVAAISGTGVVGTPTGYLAATTSPSPGTPPAPNFDFRSSLYGRCDVSPVNASKYRVNFVRNSSPYYDASLDPTFKFYMGSTQGGMTQQSTADLSQYFFADVNPGQSFWYGFTANYGPYQSPMQVVHVAALNQPGTVTAQQNWDTGYVSMTWGTVPYAASYHVYISKVPLDITASWFANKAVLTAQGYLEYVSIPGMTGSTSGCTLAGAPQGLQIYFIVVPTDASGVEGWWCRYAITTVL